MKIYLGSDHAGFGLKQKIKDYLLGKNYVVVDFGAEEYNPSDDYPDFIKPVADAVSKADQAMGIICGGSGQGEAMVANKFNNVRATVFYGGVCAKDPIDIEGNISEDAYEIVKLSRLHNDANIISLGVRFITEEEALKAIDTFLSTPFSNNERHIRRIEKI